MRRIALLATLALATTATADPKPKQVTKTDEAKAACKWRMVGKGLDRHVVCEFEAPIIVPASAPKPKVVIAPADGRKVVGRPRITDPLVGLDRRRSFSE